MQRQRMEQAGARGTRLGGGVHAGKLHEAGALEVLAGQVAALAHAVDRRARGEERGQVVQRGGVGEGRRVHAALVDLSASRVAGGSEGILGPDTLPFAGVAAPAPRPWQARTNCECQQLTWRATTSGDAIGTARRTRRPSSVTTSVPDPRSASATCSARHSLSHAP